jgi:ubiquitin C-terminal hydrolase
MQNIGNTCYFNTALQCLLHAPVLTNHFILRGYEGPCIFTQEYNKIVQHIWVQKSQDVIIPNVMFEEFRSLYPQFGPNQPSDVHETVLCIIDIFEKSLDKDWIRKHMYGQLSHRIGDEDKEQLEDFACHTVDTDESLFQNETEMDDGRKMVTSVKTIGSLFMIHFNLYKNKQLVRLPERIDGYRLCSAAMHMGGHYAAIVRHRDDWFICDDEVKKKVDHYHYLGPYYFAIYTKSSNM